jgi:hypothetical protein
VKIDEELWYTTSIGGVRKVTHRRLKKIGVKTWTNLGYTRTIGRRKEDGWKVFYGASQCGS